MYTHDPRTVSAHVDHRIEQLHRAAARPHGRATAPWNLIRQAARIREVFRRHPESTPVSRPASPTVRPDHSAA
ncbi:MAG: hypothetical protein R3320_09655 [Nitriliruptorales bacterium]|nr:hypothetical protein [Nitriliruptorales bacterium]